MKRIGEILTAHKDLKRVPMPEDFNKVSLTPEEEAYAIWDFKCGKYFEMKEREKIIHEQNIRAEAQRKFTYETLRDFVLKNNDWFVVDDQNREVFNLLCLYFSDDPKFESYGYDLKKGIILSGPVGVGKTEMLRVFRLNKKLPFHLISVYDIEEKCRTHGTHYFSTFTGFVPGLVNSKDFFYSPVVGFAFDDVGRESVVFDFGNKSDVVSKILQVRYLSKQNIPFTSLHITTNKTPAELESRYEYAVTSRLREMFNYIVMSGKDRRK